MWRGQAEGLIRAVRGPDDNATQGREHEDANGGEVAGVAQARHTAHIGIGCRG